MKTSPPTGIVIACIVLLTGCSRGPELVDHPGDHVAGEPAATYREGYGIRLSEAAAAFVGLETAEVGADDKLNPSVPTSSILKTARGTFVFAANGDWFLRTPVTVGPDQNGWSTVSEGLYEGDVVVSQGVDALWLAEISAVNGGVGCAHGH